MGKTAELSEELSIYFCEPRVFNTKSQRVESFDTIGSNLALKDFDVAIFGAETDYQSASWNSGTELAPDYIRSYLYQMPSDFNGLRIADLGNIRAGNGESVKVAVKNVVREMSEKGVMCVVLGGSNAINSAVVSGLRGEGKGLNVVLTDAALEFANRYDEHCFIPTFLDEIAEMEDVRNIDILGVQNYMASVGQTEEIDERRMVFSRLAAVQGDIVSFEPLLRDSDMYGLCARAVRSADMAGQGVPQPNGLFGQEACYLAKMAGNSDRNKAFAITELNPLYDMGNVGTYLCAQIVWHYIHGVANRYGDYPMRGLSEYSAYKVFDPPTNQEVDFYNNPLNGRWWVRIPTAEGSGVYSCSKADYECMSNRGLPNVWRRHFME